MCLTFIHLMLLVQQVMLVTPLVPLGALLDYVRRHRTNISSKALLNWSTQIAKVGCCRLLTLSPPILLRHYPLPYWSHPPFLIFDIWVFWHSGLRARAPKCQKLKMVGETIMALNPSNSSNLEQLALKRLMRSMSLEFIFSSDVPLIKC